MFGLPNKPARRFCNYLDDGPILGKWRRKSIEIISPNCWENIKGEAGVGDKQTDPDWRKNQPWVLLTSTGDPVCRPFFVYDRRHSVSGMLLREPLETRLFAMRIGWESFSLVTVGANRWTYPASCVQVAKCQRIIGSRQEIKMAARKLNQSVTFI